MSRSGYYSWQERDKSPRQIENENLIPINTYLDPGQSLDGMVNVTILQEAGQAQSYGFNVAITFDEVPAP